MEQTLTADPAAMLARLKLLLGQTESDETTSALLAFLLEELSDEVKNYCNLDGLPAGLERVLPRMAVHVWRKAGLGQENAPAAVSSVTRGDVTTSFRTGGSEQAGTAEAIAEAIGGFRAQLNAFRRLRK